MKALILCAGEATRLRPLTYALPKHLLPVANRPVIEHVIDAIKRAGITEIGLVVSLKTMEQFRAHLGDGQRRGVQLEYILQPEPRGLAHAVACARDFVSQDDFLVYLGDNLVEEGLTTLLQEFREARPEALLSLVKVEDPRRFGVAVLEGNEIKRLIEKPAEPLSNLAIAGIYVFQPIIFEAISEIRPSPRGELEITDAIQRLIDRGYRVLPHRIEGWWKDVGKPEDLLEANRLLLRRLGDTSLEGAWLDEATATTLEGPVALAPGVKVRNSHITGPVVIGADAEISNAQVGPDVALGRRCHIAQVRIQNAIIMEGARISGGPALPTLTDSIIGADAVIALQSNGRYQLLVANRSRVASE